MTVADAIGYVGSILFALSTFHVISMLIVYQFYPVYIVALLWWGGIFIAVIATVMLSIWWISERLYQ